VTVPRRLLPGLVARGRLTIAGRGRAVVHDFADDRLARGPAPLTYVSLRRNRHGRMSNRFEEIPQRVFLDSTILQTLLKYGEFLYENVPVDEADRIWQNPHGMANLEALRDILHVNERAHFQFALSPSSLAEVGRKNDSAYLRWAYDVFDHWEVCIEESGYDFGCPEVANLLDGKEFGYLGSGDRLLLKDAILLGCDGFLTFENRLPRNAAHLERRADLRVFTPTSMWQVLRPWAALFY
jgi:hypothetical protein